MRFNAVLLIENPNNSALRPCGRRFTQTAFSHQNNRLMVGEVKRSCKAG
jgi:hypothetical protein